MRSGMEGRDFKIRAGRRYTTRHAVSIRLPGGGIVQGMLSNVSRSGVGLKTSQFLEIGATVHLRVDERVEVPLQIQWQLGAHAGAKFGPGACASAVAASVRRFEQEDEA